MSQEPRKECEECGYDAVSDKSSADIFRAFRAFRVFRGQCVTSLTNYQTILGDDGKPAFVVLPYADFVKLPGVVRPGMIPNAVVGKRVMDGVSMLQAWREYLMLTQTDMAERMGISQAGYAQIEAAKRPRKATLQKAADALGIMLEQLVS